MRRDIRIILAIVFVSGGFFAIAIVTLLWKGTIRLKSSQVQTLLSSQQNSSSPLFLEPGSSDNAWNTYKNTRYGFSFRYPPDFEIYGGLSVGDISQPFYEDDSDEVVVYPTTEGKNNELGTLDIVVHDKSSTTTDGYGDATGFWSIPLPILMPKIQTLAESEKADSPLGPLTTTTIAGETAYEFNAANSIGWNGAGEIPGGDNLWIFMTASGSILEVIVSDTPTFRQVLQSFQLDEAGT